MYRSEKSSLITRIIVMILSVILFIPMGTGNVQAKSGGELNIIPVASGRDYNLAIKEDGTVWGWGDNRFNQLGLGRTSGAVPGAVQAVDIDKAVAVSAGRHHSISLKEDGTVWAWGNDAAGQTGQGTPTTKSPFSILSPVQVTNLSEVVAIAAGSEFNLALKQDGTVWSWGNNIQGSLGDGTTASRYAPVQIEPLSAIESIAAGVFHSLAVKSDGTVWSWGYNERGQLGDGNRGGRYGVFNNGIDQNTPVQVMYVEDINQIELAEPLQNVKAVAAGLSHSLALKKDGTVWAWGRNDQGQLGNGTWSESLFLTQVINLNNVIAIAAGNNFSLALKSDGSVWAWGQGQKGELGQFTEVTGATTRDGKPTNYYSYADGFHHPLDSNKPLQIKGLSDITAIAAGSNHGVAVTKKGNLCAWGFNDYGQIGNGTAWTRGYPLTNVKTSVGGGPFRDLSNIRQPSSTTSPPPAAPPAPSPATPSEDVGIYIDGQKQAFDDQPVIVQGRTLLPMRDLFQALGAVVGWDGVTSTAIGTRDGIEVRIPIGSTTPTVNGKPTPIQVPAQLINNRTYVPLRFVGEALGDDVKWDGESRSVVITKK